MTNAIVNDINAEKELYTEWLYSLIADDATIDGKSYYVLFGEMKNIPFVVSDPKDEARIDEGRNLRDRYLEKEHKNYLGDFIFDEDVSFLEVMIALAERFAFEVIDRINTKDAFKEMLKNAELLDYNDNNIVAISDIKHVREIIKNIIGKNIEFNGVGGMFPIYYTSPVDQRTRSFFDQMQDYIYENYDE